MPVPAAPLSIATPTTPGIYEWQAPTGTWVPLTPYEVLPDGSLSPLTVDLGVANPGVPTAPYSLAERSHTATTATVTWAEDIDNTSAGHRLYVDGVQNGPQFTAGARSWTATDLDPSTTYQVTARRYNAFGESPDSNPLSVTTDAAVAGIPTAPATLTRTALTSTGASFAWTEAADPSVLGHRMYLDGIKRGTDLSASALSGSVTALTPGTPHTLYATRFNVAGESPPSPSVPFTTLPVVAVRDFAGRKPQPRIGMSSPANVWDTRFGQVAGQDRLTARRVFANFTENSVGHDQANLVEAAAAAGLMPTVSFKDASPMAPLSSTTIAQAQRAGAHLAGLGVPVTASYWHEPNDNFPGAAGSDMFVAKQKLLMPLFKAPSVARCMIHNGWLIDNLVSRFDDFAPDELFDGDYWECFGFDTYQAGATIDTPSTPLPGDRIIPIRDHLKARGYGDWQCLIGEYNGWTGAAIADVGEKVMTVKNDNGDPFVWLAMMWNATTGKGVVLDHNAAYGDRLGAFQGTLADSRIWKPEDPGETVP